MAESDHKTYYIVYDAAQGKWNCLDEKKPDIPDGSHIWLAPLFPYPFASMPRTTRMFTMLLNAAHRFENDPFRDERIDGQVIAVGRNDDEHTKMATKLLEGDDYKLLLDESGLIHIPEEKWALSSRAFSRDNRHANFPCCSIDFTQGECDRYAFISSVQPIQIHAHVLEEALDKAGCEFLPELASGPGSIFWSHRANKLALMICESLFSGDELETLRRLFGAEEWEGEMNEVWQYVKTPPREQCRPLNRIPAEI